MSLSTGRSVLGHSLRAGAREGVSPPSGHGGQTSLSHEEVRPSQ